MERKEQAAFWPGALAAAALAGACVLAAGAWFESIRAGREAAARDTESAALARKALDALERLEARAALDAEAAGEAERLQAARTDGIDRALAGQARTLERLALRLEALDKAVRNLPGGEIGFEAAARDLETSRAIAAGRRDLERGRYASAAERFTEALRLQPESGEARRLEAESRFLINPSDTSACSRARNAAREALGVNPRDPLALEVLALVCEERGDWPGAAEYRKRLAAAAAR